MTTFAEELVARIRAEAGFWSDIELISSRAIAQIIPGVEKVKVIGNDAPCIHRLLQSAITLTQTNSDSDKALAQDIAFFSALASTDESDRGVAEDVLFMLGNLPGAERLSLDLEIGKGSFTNYLRHWLLRDINTVAIDGRNFALTDFQRKVWSGLPKHQIAAISAPTSAGKSFVVVEYLCQEVQRAEKFVAVFVAPTRALIGEIQRKIHNRFSDRLDTRVSTIPTLDRDGRPKQIFVLTQERLQVLLTIWSGSFDLVIVDEAQAIGDESRGMILQDCLETVVSRDTTTRFLFLAPGAESFEALSDAIGFGKVDVSSTELSPVVQNRIIVEPVPGEANTIRLARLTNDRILNIGSFFAKRGFEHSDTRLAAVALELGKLGGSLVYGTGPADAQRVAGQIASALPVNESSELKDLSEFIDKHVHPKFSLVSHVLKGVGVHYGKMPSLLREALEEAFKKEQLKYLVCTTTLFQGVNLPARSVFIDTPTRGRGVELDAAALWNFAGRAGRLGQDIVGNVFLVGYESWESKPMSDRARFSITPSFKKTINHQKMEVLARLKGDDGDFDPINPIPQWTQRQVC